MFFRVDRDDESREASEALVRSIMHLPNKPAVMFVGSFALKPQNTKDGQLSGMDAHSPVAAYYDVPQVRFSASALLLTVRQ